jgi:hypothetical protein
VVELSSDRVDVVRMKSGDNRFYIAFSVTGSLMLAAIGVLSLTGIGPLSATLGVLFLVAAALVLFSTYYTVSIFPKRVQRRKDAET